MVHRLPRQVQFPRKEKYNRIVRPTYHKPIIFDALRDGSDFFAGWADALTGGAASWYREANGFDDVVHHDSNWYKGGFGTGEIHNVLMILVGGGEGLAGEGEAGALAAEERIAAAEERIIAERGGAPRPVLPDDANVVRGGIQKPTIQTHPSGVQGISVESAPGLTVEELAKAPPPISNSQIRTTTVGQVRQAGGRRYTDVRQETKPRDLNGPHSR